MSDEEQKGYTAEIPDEAIAEALQSVEKRKKKPDPPAAGQDTGQEEEVIEVPVEIAESEGEEGTGARRRGPSAEELAEALQKAREEAKAARDRMLRALADADNQRKRLAKEKQEIIKFSQEGLMRDLLVPLDNLERTLEHVPHDSGNPTLDSLRQGVEMVLKMFEEVLQRHDLKGFSAVGQKFDPALHEAVSRVEDPEADEGTVVSELHRGYMLHDRLLRPALVTVACAPGQGDTPPEEGETSTDEDPGDPRGSESRE